MSPRTACLQVAHQRGCPNESKTSLSSVGSESGCKCRPRYYTLHRDERGRRVKGNRLGDRKVAEKELRKIQVEIDEGRATVSRTRSTLTLPEWVDRYLSEIIDRRVSDGTLKPSTRESYEESLRMAVHELGHIELAAMDAHDIRRFVHALGDVAPATKLRRLRDLRACLNEAGRKPIEHNPVSDYLRTAEGKGLTKAVPKRGKDAFTDVELEKLWQGLKKTADEVYLYLFKSAVATGARVSELCGLDWDDVDLLDGTVLISKQYMPTHGMTSPKDGEERTVYLTAEGKDTLVGWATVAGTAGPVFVGRQGERINSDYTWRVLERARKEAGIPKLGESGKPRSVHSLRDTYARRMLEAGRHPQWVQENLGLSNLELTMNVYGPWGKDARAAEAARPTEGAL